jgi:uncharacterized protein
MEFEIKKANGMMIRGKKYVSEEENEVLILCHGFTASMKETGQLAQGLMARGITTYVFDFCGGGFETISDGSFNTYMTPLTEVEDLEYVVDYVLRQEGLESVCVGGCSQGGFVSCLYARNEAKVNKLVLLYPALCIPDDARNGNMQVIQFDPENIPDVLGQKPMQVCGDYARSVIHINTYEEIQKCNCPILIVHGTDDKIVPIEYVNNAKDVLGRNCEYHILQGAGHGFYEEPYYSQALEYVENFLE